jgi:hypothetical protein
MLPLIIIVNYFLQRNQIRCENRAHSKYSRPCPLYFLDGKKFAKVPSLQERTSLSISQSNRGRKDTAVAVRLNTIRNCSTKRDQILGYLAMP